MPPIPFCHQHHCPTNPTSNATPPVPHIDVDNQILTDEGEVTIASVMSSQPGWAAVYAFPDDELGEILGVTAVQTGLNTQVNVKINPLQATPTLAVVLHVDEGTTGEFEYPNGADVPLRFETGIIAQTFNPQFELSLPVITIKDQEILEDGLLHVDKVVALTPGWLLIHADEDGELGEYLGSTSLTAGANENLTVHIPWQQGTSTLHAVIYTDNGRAQQLDPPDIDTPFLVNGDSVAASFRVTYPPDLFVLDQPIIDGKFEVERATSNGPGWLVVYYDEDGQQGLIIGYEALKDGVNEHIEVEVLHTAVTNPLYIRLHEDSEPGDVFDFPRVDPPVVYQGRQLLPYRFNTEPGAYLATRDQIPEEVGDGELQVTIPYAIVDGPSWVVVQVDVNGVLGEVLGMAQLQAGLNRDVVVRLDPSKATGPVQAALYIDAGEAGNFEYPNGADTPIQRNRRTLASPFVLLNVGAESLSPTEE
ncbi:MAG: hypothetical protein HC804_11700 [Anaerolineae bacterium]|nr:hypothetical protein [Anaerolineae bacterium]